MPTGATMRIAHTNSTRFMAALAVIAVLFAMLLASPSAAHAKSYTMPQVTIDAQVQADGSLHVVERRTFDFDGSFTAVWWEIGSLPPEGSVTFNGMRMGVVPEDGSAPEMHDVAQVPFEVLWRTEGGPGTTAYSVDASQDTCYLFFDVADATMTAEVDYTITNAATIYADCAELYWKFVGDAWQVASRGVTCNISLPAPEDAAPVAGETVRAWGHGSLSGQVAFGQDASQVVYTIEYVAPGDNAEARIVFPQEWITDRGVQTSLAHAQTSHLDEVLAEEARWADEANAKRQTSFVGLVACVAAALALIVWGFVMFFRHGREHKPAFEGDYWRDDPDPGVHPAVISRLWTFNRKRSTDFTATIMYLVNQGALRIDNGSYETPTKLGGSKTVEDYYLTRNPNYKSEDPYGIDKDVLDLLFNKVSKDGKQLWLGEIALWGKKNPQKFVSAMDAWQGKVTNALEARNYFEDKGSSMQVLTVVVASIALAAGIGLSMFIENFVPVISLGVGAAVLYILAVFMPRRSYEGVDVHARCEALCKWLTEFSLLDEKPPTDVKVWGRFMVYAYIFGVADRVLKELRSTIPQVFQEQDSLVVRGNMYSPWYTMYDINGVSRRASFAVAMDNTLEVVTDAISAAASASGGGGGFSGGGGGGFGGGGGGGAR